MQFRTGTRTAGCCASTAENTVEDKDQELSIFSSNEIHEHNSTVNTIVTVHTLSIEILVSPPKKSLMKPHLEFKKKKLVDNK